VRDEVEAARYFKLAADQHHVDRQFHDGLYFDDGRGVVKDEVEAARYYNRLPIRIMPMPNTVMRSALRRSRCCEG
jgi:hypothetical protein